jgi:hypothetical protein
MMTKRLLLPAALVAALATAAAAQSHPAEHGDRHGKQGEKHAQEHGHRQGPPSEQAAPVTLAEGQAITRGAGVSADAPGVKLADVLKGPAKYADRVVVVEGVVERVCQKQGCWMELAPEKGARGVRVAMKDHAFFVPFNSAGLRARAEGTFEVKTLTREDADHYEKEGARLTRNPDGTATEVSFTASGVELRK